MKRVRGASPARLFITLALVPLVAVSLVAAVAGGLLRAGTEWPSPHGAAFAAQAAGIHAALMLSGFLGMVIAVERAVAVRLRWAFGAPAAAGLASVALLATIGAVWAAWRRLPAGRARGAVLALGGSVALQYALGVATLVQVVPVSLGTLHQATAVLVLAAALVAAHALRPAKDQAG